MRNHFIDALLNRATKDPSVILITGDLGYGVLDKFAAKLPDQYINAGVAEQNMIGVASGLAFSGYEVYVYSIANFPTFRCLEQLRNDVSFHDLDVTVVSVGAGLSYGSLGYSHFAVEDISVMRALPNMNIFNPGSTAELDSILPKIWNTSCPKYLRLDKQGAPVNMSFHKKNNGIFQYLKSDNADSALLTSGTILGEVIEAAKVLERKGINVDVFSAPHMSFDSSSEMFSEYRKIVVVEEHSRIGGLFSMISESFAHQSNSPRILSIATKPQFYGRVGSQSYLRSLHGLDSNSIAIVGMEIFA